MTAKQDGHKERSISPMHRAEKQTQRLSFTQMNTAIAVLAEHEEEAWQTDVTDWFREFERICSRFLPTSSLTQFNKTEPNIPLIVHPILYDTIQTAVAWANKTDFYFNPFMLKQIEQLGYNESFHEGWKKHGVATKQVTVQQNPLRFHDHIKAIEKRRPVQMDLGGIGKGVSVDQAAQLMKDAAISRGLVDAGGDMCMWSNDAPWKIGIRHPYDKSRTLFSVYIQHGAIATSSKWHRKWQQNEQWQHHLLNGHTGLPSETGVIQATVIARNATTADVLAKLLTILPVEQVQKYDSDFGYAIIEKDGTLTINKRMRSFIAI